MNKSGMNELMDGYNAFVGSVIAILTALLGKYWFLFVAFLVLNVFDFITGWAKARKLQKENSKKGKDGVVKKLWYWMMIAIAFMLAKVFMVLGQDFFGTDLSILKFLGWFVLASLMINELRSIIENFVEMDVYVPDILKKGLAITQLMLRKKEEELDNYSKDKEPNKLE